MNIYNKLRIERKIKGYVRALDGLFDSLEAVTLEMKNYTPEQQTEAWEHITDLVSKIGKIQIKKLKLELL